MKVGDQSNGGPAQGRLAASTRTGNKDAFIRMKDQVEVMNCPSIGARISVGGFFKAERHEGCVTPRLASVW
jgi:hypothetical protein